MNKNQKRFIFYFFKAFEIYMELRLKLNDNINILGKTKSTDFS